MARSRWKMTLLTAFAGAGVAWGQQGTAPHPVAPARGERIITVQEFGGQQLQCRVLQTWIQPDGSTAYEVQILSTGEKMTIAEASDVAAPPGTKQHGRMTRMYHWGQGKVPPPGTPVPPVIQAQATQTVMQPAMPSCDIQATVASQPRLAPTPATTVEETVVQGPESAPRAHGLAARVRKLFHRHADADATDDMPMDGSTQVIETTSAPMPAGTTVLKPGPAMTASPAQVGDARQSWGKADNQEAPVIAPAGLPQADTQKPDPLQNLSAYTKMPTMNKNADRFDRKMVSLKNGSNSSVEVAEAVSSSGTPAANPPAASAPLGQASIKSAQTKYEPNAFSKWVKSPDAAPAPQNAMGGNAFTQPRPQQPVQPMGQPMQPAYQTPMMSMPGNNVSMSTLPPQPISTVMYATSPAGQASSANASPYHAQPSMVIATPVASQPMAIPSQDVGSGVIQQAGMIVPAQPNTNSQDGKLIGMMHEALFPSQRESAAEQLAASSPSSPQVMAAMMDVARHDPAVSVRTCCIRCLATMKANTPEVRQALHELRNDSDSAVSHAAADALTAFRQ